MKKLIAISVILVLLTAVAFAETSWGGAVFVNATLAEGNTKPGPAGADITTGLNLSRLRFDGSASNDEGTFGGYLRLQQGDFSGFGWWKPIDALKIQLGDNADGQWDPTNIVGYGFWEAASGWGVGIIPEGGSYFGGTSFYGGIGKGLLLSITPLEALAINIGIPLANGALVKDTYLSSDIQVSYNIDGIGTVYVTYDGGAGHKDWEGPKNGKDVEYNTPGDPTSGVKTPGYATTPAKPESNDPGSVFLSFDLSAIENLGLNFGVGYKFGYKNIGAGTVTGTGTDADPYVITANDNKADDWKENGALAIGLGVSYNITDQFGLKVRVQAADLLAGGSNEWDVAGVAASRERKDSINIGADLLPSFAVSDAFKIFLAAGMRFDTAAVTTAKAGSVTTTTTTNSSLDWYAQPYISYSAGPGTFYAGFRLAGTGERAGEVKSEGGGSSTTTKSVTSLSSVAWSIPIGIAISF